MPRLVFLEGVGWLVAATFWTGIIDSFARFGWLKATRWARIS